MVYFGFGNCGGRGQQWGQNVDPGPIFCTKPRLDILHKRNYSNQSLYEMFFGLGINPSLKVYSRLRCLLQNNPFGSNHMITSSDKNSASQNLGQFSVGLKSQIEDDLKFDIEFLDTYNYHMKLNYINSVIIISTSPYLKVF